MSNLLPKSKAKKIVDSYIELLRHLNRNAGILQPKLGLNKNWTKITDNLDIIYCGDNPGTKELEGQEYFIGGAGKELQNFVTLTDKILKIREKAFFNKTPYSSARTNDIKETDDPEQIIEKSIILTINCLYRLWKNNPKLKVFIFGHSSSYIVDTFRKILKIKVISKPDFANSIMVFSHPSQGHIYKDMGHYIVSELIKQNEIKLNYNKILNVISKKSWL